MSLLRNGVALLLFISHSASFQVPFSGLQKKFIDSSGSKKNCFVDVQFHSLSEPRLKQCSRIKLQASASAALPVGEVRRDAIFFKHEADLDNLCCNLQAESRLLELVSATKGRGQSASDEQLEVRLVGWLVSWLVDRVRK
jgi:hypothetical protein